MRLADRRTGGALNGGGGRVRWSGGIAAILMLLLALAAVATARPGNRALWPARRGDVATVYLVDNGFHTDIAVPRAAVLARGGPLAAAALRTSTRPWIMIGWGDARFYEATAPWRGRLMDGLRALLGGRPTTLHLEGVWDRPDRVWTNGVRPLPLSSAGLRALLSRAGAALAVDAGGAPRVLDAPGREPDEAFFASREGFSLFHLCNHFTADLLSAAGLPATPVLDTLPAGMMLDLKLRAGV
jgi:hypothetical protein